MPEPDAKRDRTQNAPDRSDTASQDVDGTSQWVESKAGAAGVLPGGTRIGHFEVRDVLGTGSFGIVYRAFDPTLKREVAIKFPHEAWMPDDKREAFLHEARAAAAIHHQNICPVYEVGTLAGRPYIVMHLVAGPTLAKVLSQRKTPFPPATAAAIVRKLALGVAAAHARNVTHRDLKPANVLVNDVSWDVLITDFGLALLAEDVRGSVDGNVKGTPAYMSPEQARGDIDAIGPLADVHALGIILYELATHKRPFPGQFISVLLEQVKNDIPRPPSLLRTGIDPAFDAICLKALAKNPKHRFASAKDFATALGDYLREGSSRSNVEKPVDSSSTDVTEAWQEFLEAPVRVEATLPPTPRLEAATTETLREPPVPVPPPPPRRTFDLDTEPRPRVKKASSNYRTPAMIAAGVAVLLCVVFGVWFGVLRKGPDSKKNDPTPEIAGPPPAPKAGDVRSIEIAPGVSMVFCWVPPGECQLGSPKLERNALLKLQNDTKEPDWLQDEAEERRGKFRTPGYWMGKFEVTQSEWTAVMKAVVFKNVDLGTPSYFRTGGAGAAKVRGFDTSRFPVENVSWEHCREFAKRATSHGGIVKALGKPGKFALPHEDQWEYAARGGLGNYRPFFWGESLNGSQANCDGTFPFGTVEKSRYLGHTCSADETNDGSYPAHPWGLRHIHGNVWEWCENTYGQTEERVLRGGSWFYYCKHGRAAYRLRNSATQRDESYGCRLIVTME